MDKFYKSVKTLNTYGTMEERLFAIAVFISVRLEGKTLPEACKQHGQTLSFYQDLRDRINMYMNLPTYAPVAKVAFVALVALVAVVTR